VCVCVCVSVPRDCLPRVRVHAFILYIYIYIIILMFTVRPAAVSSHPNVSAAVCVKAREVFAVVVVVVDVVIVLGTRCTQQLLSLALSVAAAAVFDGPTGCCFHDPPPPITPSILHTLPTLCYIYNINIWLCIVNNVCMYYV